MDESATNYNPAATEDDGTCEYDDDETSTDFAGISGFDSSSIECGPTGDISIAGSSTVFPVATCGPRHIRSIATESRSPSRAVAAVPAQVEYATTQRREPP